MTEAPAARTSPATRLTLGVLLILVAMVFFGASRLIAGSQRHAYDPGATPPPTYRLTAGNQYQLASVDGVKKLTAAGILGTGTTVNCQARADTGQNDPLTIDEVKTDDRDLHVFATFTSQSSGDFHVSCERIAAVFVDDADHSGRDWSGIGILVAALVGVLGMAMSLSGGYELHGGGGPGTAAIEPGGVTASDGRSAPASDQPRIEVSEGPVDESE